MIPTPKFRPAASVLLVGVDDALVERIDAAIKPIQVLRASHGSAAAERMLSTQPLVVVVGSGVDDGALATITERAAAMGAELALVEAFPSPGSLVLRVVSGIMLAEQRRSGGTDP
jgi:hypothetical protein